MTTEAEPLIITDKRRKLDVDVPVVVESTHMYVGQFYEINGVCYRVRKVTPYDVVLRRFTGQLLVEKVHATAQQIQGARPA